MENQRSVYWNTLRNVGEQPKTDSKKITKELSVIQPIFTQWSITGCDKSHAPKVNGALTVVSHPSSFLSFLLMSLLSFGCKTLQAHIVSYRLCFDLKQFSRINRVCWAPRATSLVWLYWQGGGFGELRQRKLWTVLELVPGLVLRLIPVNGLVRVNFTALSTSVEVLGEHFCLSKKWSYRNKSEILFAASQTVNRDSLCQPQLSKTTLPLFENPLKGTTAPGRGSYSHTTVWNQNLF